MGKNTYCKLILLFVIKYSLIPIVILTDKLDGSDRMILFETTANFSIETRNTYSAERSENIWLFTGRFPNLLYSRRRSVYVCHPTIISNLSFCTSHLKKKRQNRKYLDFDTAAHQLAFSASDTIYSLPYYETP
jgi:hypothetical protein